MSTQSTTTPVPVNDIQGDNRWISVHEHQVEEAKFQNPRIVLVGDSMIKYMGDSEMWDTLFKPMNAGNFGIGGDCTEHVLWRLQNGILDNVNPNCFVVLVGTNNWLSTSEEVAEGIEAIAWCIASAKPNSHILVVGILPRGRKPNQLRDKNCEVNNILQKILPTIPQCHYVDVDFGIVRNDKTINTEYMTDYLHLNRKGNAEVGKIIHNCIKNLGLDK